MQPVGVIDQILIQGQSLASGHHYGRVATPEPLNPGRALMFPTSERLLANAQGPLEIKTAVDPAALSAFVDLVAVYHHGASQTLGPTLADGLLAAAPDHVAYLVTNAAIGASHHAQRTKGCAPYDNLIKSAQAAFRIARRTGREHRVSYLVSIDGESDRHNAKDLWMARKRGDRANFDADIKAINGQANDIVCVTDQMGYPLEDAPSAVPLAQMQLALDDPAHFICVGPKYHLEPDPDLIHLVSVSSARRGAEFAYAIVNGMTLPPHIAAAERDGDKVLCTWGGDFVGPIVIDAERVSDPGAYGLTWHDDGQGNRVSIAGCSAIENGRMIVTLSDVPTGADQRIGTARHLSVTPQIGPVGGPRSCFRDSATATYTIAGVAYPLHRWAAHWETPVTQAA